MLLCCLYGEIKMDVLILDGMVPATAGVLSHRQPTVLRAPTFSVAHIMFRIVALLFLLLKDDKFGVTSAQ